MVEKTLYLIEGVNFKPRMLGFEKKISSDFSLCYLINSPFFVGFLESLMIKYRIPLG
jgi:hypothetical protein